MFGLEIAGDEPATMDAVDRGRSAALIGPVNPDRHRGIAVTARNLTILDPQASSVRWRQLGDHLRQFSPHRRRIVAVDDG
jgi:hypothetical protein